MEFNELIQKNIEELKEMLSEHQALLRELRFKAHSGALKAVKTISQTRKTVAQIQTALKQLEKKS